MDSLTAPAQIEGLESVLPMLEEARHEEALPIIEDQMAKRPDVPVWKYLKALVLACQARGQEAAGLLSDVAKQDGYAQAFGLPHDVNTLARTSALNHLHFETSVEPEAVEPWLNLEQVARLLNNNDFAGKAIIGRWKANPEDPAMPKLFDRLFAHESLDDKIKRVEEILADNEDACLPRACLGYYLQEKGKTALAIRHLKKALESDAQAWQPHLYLGRVFFSQGRFEDAENRFSEAIEIRKEGNAELLAEIAACQKATYRYEEALESFFQALEQDPTEFSNWSELEELSSAMGTTERLVQTVQRVAERDPSNLDLAARVVNLALNSNDPLEAERKVKASGIMSAPQRSIPMTLLATKTMQTLGKPELGVKLLETTLQSNPNDLNLKTAYGRALMESGKHIEAEGVLRETAMQQPNEREVQIAWGRALLAIGEAEKANRTFSVASRLSPEDPEALAEQGRALAALGKTDEAASVLKESAKQSDQPRAVTLIGLGSIYEKKSLKDIAKDFYRQALSKEPGSILAADGWVRLQGTALNEFKSDVEALLKEQSTDFGKAEIYRNLLFASLRQGMPACARLLHQDFFESVKSGIATAEYVEYLDKQIVGGLAQTAQSLETNGQTERAREVWRFAVTSNDSELSQKATAELLRLDTVEAEQESEPSSGQAPQPESELLSPETEEVAEGSSDDPLLSLLSTTLPGDGTVPLFAEPGAIEATPSSVDEEAPLFATDPQESVFADPSLESSLFQLEEPVAPEAPETPESFEPEDPLATEAPETLEPEDPLDTAPSASEEPEEPVAIAATAPTEPEEPVAIAPPAPAEPEDPVTIAPSSLEEPADPVAIAPPAPAEPPENTSIPAPPVEASAPDERKELLPIPMAVDFEPQTRRQLHFHEALIKNQGGVLSPESIAHLMVCSSLGHEPPDPSSSGDPTQNTKELQTALLSSAQDLAGRSQYRSASRVLKTALLYSPEANEITAALCKILSDWAAWLTESNEYAHAVSLIRDALQRTPQSDALDQQLEATYQSWMAWSDENGDSAARDLLAVYLEQERASIASFRAQWQAAMESRPAQPTVAATPSPQVGASMPTPPAQVAASAPDTAVSASLPEPVQEAAVPAASTPANETSTPATEPTPAEQTAAAVPAESIAQQDVATESTAPEPVSTPAAATAVAAATPETPEEVPQAVETAPTPEPVPQASVPPTPEPAPQAVEPTPTPEPAPQAVETTPVPESAPPAVEEVSDPAAAGVSFSSSEEALSSLDSSPDDETLSQAVFAYFKDDMRTLTTALRDRSSGSDEPIWLLLLARAFRMSGSETMAVIQYQKYIKAAPSLEAYEELATTYEEIGKEDFAKMTRRKAERAFS